LKPVTIISRNTYAKEMPGRQAAQCTDLKSIPHRESAVSIAVSPDAQIRGFIIEREKRNAQK
jgi:hypothetical protein